MTNALAVDQKHSSRTRNLFLALSTPIQLLASHYRPFWLLKLVKAAKPKSFSAQLQTLFDPNFLRKKFKVDFDQNLVLVDAYGGKFQIDINDHLGYKFFMKGGFDNFLIWVGERLDATKSDILLDIGANIGSTCVPFAIRFGTEIIAVEASKTNAAILLKNAALNGIRIQCHCVCAVDEKLASDRRYLEFFINNGNAAASSIFNGWNPSVTSATLEYPKTAVLDNLVEECDINSTIIIKIDVEGAEEMVLRGMSKLLNAGIPIAFEYRVDVMLRDLNDDGSALLSILQKTHTVFGVEAIGDQYSLVDFDARQPYENALALPNSNLEFLRGRLVAS